MQFKVTVTAKNGFDSADDTVYTTESEYSFIVQNVQYLRGKIKKDITLDRSRFWIIDGNITFENSSNMLVKPGTQVLLKGEISGFGSVICKGTEILPVTFICDDSQSSWIHTQTNAIYTNFISITELFNLNADHCKIIFPYRNTTNRNTKRMIENSFFKNSIICEGYFPSIDYSLGDYWEYSSFFTSNATNCLFYSIDIIYPHAGNNNVYLNRQNTSPHFLELAEDSNTNAILYNDNVTINDLKSINYFGTDNSKIDKYYTDYDEEENFENHKTYLTLDSPKIEEIYPFMTEAYVTNEKGERIENAYPGQTLFVHVKFNRDMATDVQPEVSVGCGPTHTGEYYQYADDLILVKGDWVSSREWVGYTSFDISFLEKGYNKPTSQVFVDDHEIVSSRFFGIRSEGAVAADDRWLVTGNDGGRFGFNLVKPATIQTGDSETAKLSGKGIAGANQLTWSQDETETLAGYNLYRSVGDNTSFTKLNTSLLSGEDLQYKDTDVVEGQTYYYYFTTVDTDFHESARSNVVECVPLDGEKPTIVHTPVTYSEPNKAIVISADVTDNVKVEDVELFYKYSDESDWNSVSMRNPSGSTYKATLSAYEVKDGEIQYYIAASDGLSKAYFGTAGEPNVITVKPYVEITTTEPATTTTGIDTTATSTDTTTTGYNDTTSPINSSTVATSAIEQDITTEGTQTTNDSVSTEATTVASTNNSGTETTTVSTSETYVMNELYCQGLPNGIQLTWTVDSIDNVAGYNIYRSKSFNNYFKKINTSIIPNEETTYTDRILDYGKKYYYYITIVFADSSESAPSNVVSATTMDIVEPTIVHSPITYSEPEKLITISAKITDNFKIETAELFYKYSDEGEWQSMEMMDWPDSEYRAYVSADLVREGVIQYYIKASDGFNTVYSGTMEEPYTIHVKPYAETTTYLTDSETASSATETTTESNLTTDTTTQTTAESTETTTSATDSETASSATETTTESNLTTDTTTQTTAESTETTTSVTDSETASSTTETTTESGLTTDTTTQTTVASTTTEPVSTSATSTTPIEPDYTLGDVNNDGKVDAKDASLVLVEYAKMSTGGTGDFTEVQKLAANVNSDSKIDAKDASFILTYYAMASTASGDIPTMKEFMTPKQT